jgi:hypothetical protein
MNKIYVVTLELELDLDNYDGNGPIIELTKPFLITSDSDPVLIADYVIEQEIRSCHKYNLEQIYSNKEILKKPVVIAKYCKFPL